MIRMCFGGANLLSTTTTIEPDKLSGSRNLFDYYKPKVGESIIWLRADGFELSKIREQLSNIRMAHSDSVIWRGTDAQFIYDNLLL